MKFYAFTADRTEGFCSNPSLRGLEDANVLETMFDRSCCVKLICCIKTLKKNKKDVKN